MKTNAVLPQDEAELLRGLRERKEYDALYARTFALRSAKWPLRAIADPVGVSRMAVKTWEDRAKQRGLAKAARDLQVPQLPLDAVGSEGHPTRRPIDVPPADRERLKVLAADAKRVRRWTPVNAPERQAAAELDQLLVRHVEMRKVQPMIVARHAGVTRRAVMARLERHHARNEARSAS